MSGTEELRKEKQALRKEIHDLKNQLKKFQSLTTCRKRGTKLVILIRPP